MTRIKMTLEQIRAESEMENPKSLGICALVSVRNANGQPAIYFKY